MPSLVEVIAKQAQSTFSQSISVSEETFGELLTKLVQSVHGIRAFDLMLTRDVLRSAKSSNASIPSAPVTYIGVAANETFSMGVFLLKSGSRIPLHDHPGMHGILKVIDGTVKITSYSAYFNDETVPDENLLPQDIISKVQSSQKDSLVPVIKQMSGNITEKDEPCVLSPKEGNYHEIRAFGGPAAFLDILAPPYDYGDTRDCHFYRVLETKNTDSRIKAWLLPKPSYDFQCDFAAYKGPRVSV